jgi:N-methylhydantoinase B
MTDLTVEGSRVSTDPVGLEVLRHQAQAICEEMSYTLQRTSHTVFVNETADFATGLASLEGELFAYPQSVGVSVMVNANLAVAIEAVGPLEPGDIVITNDPYTSGSLASHLPDTNLFAPVFDDGELVAYAWAYVHSTDVGGKVPGSISPAAGDVFQEGTRIAPSKLYRRGELDPQVLGTMMRNCRVPDDNWGDIKAVVAALNIGVERVAELADRHGAEAFRALVEDLLVYAHDRATTIFSEVPDGRYEFVDFLDNDFVTDNPIRLDVGVIVDGGEITLDYRRCDVQAGSALNIPSLGRPHPWLVYKLISFLYSADPNVPINGGLLRSVKVLTRPGSIVDCQFPAAMGLRTTTSLRLMDALHGALSSAVPGTLPAASGGAMVPVVVAELDLERGGRNVQTVEPLAGGTGAGAEIDGVDGRDVGLANLRNTPIEIVEADSSIVIREYALAVDSGGPGRRRGGTGVVLEFEVRRPDTVVTARGMERQRFRAWGAGGGRPGGVAYAVLNPGTEREELVKRLDGISLDPGDRLRLVTSGGGGYGDPLEREPGAVLEDFRRGAVSIEAAWRDYGVAIIDGAIDDVETRRLRDAAEPAGTDAIDLGPERRAFDVEWPPELQRRLVDALYELPVALRPYAKAKAFAMLRATDPDRPWEQRFESCWGELLKNLDLGEAGR